MKKIKYIKSIRRRTWLKAIGIASGIFLLLLLTGYTIVKANMGKIETAIHDSLDERLNGTITIGSTEVTLLDHFPHFSVVLNEVKLTDNSYAVSKVALFEANKVYFQIRVWSLLRKKIEFRALTLNYASINIIQFENGELNTAHLLEPDPDAKMDINALLISRLYLHSVDMHYKSLQTEQDFNITAKESTMRLSHGDSVSTIHSDDKFFVTGLLFKPERGVCLLNKNLRTYLNIDWNRISQAIRFETSKIVIDKNIISLTGSIIKEEKTKVNLLFHTGSVMMTPALSWISSYSRDKLKGYDFSKPLSAELYIKGTPSIYEPMDIDLYFRTKGNTFITPSRQFDAAELQAHYTNHLIDTVYNGITNNGLEFTSFKATYEGIPFSMKLLATNFTDPMLDMYINCNMSLTKLNGALDTSALIFNAGKIDLQAEFRGKLQGYTNKEKDSMNAVIFGRADITNAGCNFPKKKYMISNMNAAIVFDQKDMQVKDMSLTLNNNVLHLNAIITNFVSGLVLPDSKLKATAQVTCTKFDLNEFSKPVESSATPAVKKKIATIVASILDNLEGTLDLNAGTITYNKFVLQQIKGTIVMGSNYIGCENLSMLGAKGKMTLNGRIVGIGSARPSVDFTTDVQNADITTLFYQLDNFNQTAVTSKNVEGSISAQASLHADFTRSFVIDPRSLSGKLNFTVSNGALTNMASLNEISKNIFRKKDFSNIQFAELINSTTLTGGELHIENMEIQSNVLTMYVQGTYSFSDSTALFIRVPVKSLKVQEDDYIAENKAPDEKIGMSINLKATRVDGKLKVIPMLFHKPDRSKSEAK